MEVVKRKSLWNKKENILPQIIHNKKKQKELKNLNEKIAKKIIN